MRLWQRIFWVSAVLVLLATTALVALQQSRLERGLLGYLDRIEVDKARNFAALVLEDYQAHGGFAQPSERPQRLGRLVEAGRTDQNYAQIDWQRPPEHEGRPPPLSDGRPPPRGGPPPPWDREAPPPRAYSPPPPRVDLPPPPRADLPPPRSGSSADALDFVQRFGLFDAGGTLISGNSKAGQTAHIFPLMLAAQKIGELRLIKLPALSSEWDRHFVYEQLRASILPLFRADASRSRAHGGAGLGLAIAKMIVIAHGGTLNARASDLGGVRVEVLLPAQNPEHAEVAAK